MSTKRSWLKRFKWAPLPVGVGLGYIAYQQYCHVIERESRKNDIYPYWPTWKRKLYDCMPLRTISRCVGWLADCNVPIVFRKPIYGTFVKLLSCDMSEAIESDLTTFPTFNHFFTRPLKPERRPISYDVLVSPADGHIQHLGPITNDIIEQVKGITYSLSEFLGDEQKINLQNDNKLYCCVVYLSPAKYHGFHSPANWIIRFRRHFVGDLYSVRQKIIENVPKLFCRNERVLLSGDWKWGYFSMTAVGATIVGQIKIFNDPLQTNLKSSQLRTYEDRVLDNWRRDKGDKLGEFRLGSSIVLVFEAPTKFSFTVRPGDSVRYGQTLGFVKE